MPGLFESTRNRREPLDDLSLLGLWRAVMARREAQGQAAVIAALIAALLAARPSPSQLALGLAAGALLWIALEYPLHRFLLHSPWVERLGPRVIAVHDRLHEHHHRTPADPKPVFFGPLGVVVLLGVPLAAGLLVADAAGALAAALGFALTLLNYQAMHVATHTGYRPRTRWFARMKRAHLYHHFGSPKRCFALTAPWLDHVFGTWYEPGAR